MSSHFPLKNKRGYCGEFGVSASFYFIRMRYYTLCLVWHLIYFFHSTQVSACLLTECSPFSMNVSFLANTELNLSSLLSEEGELISLEQKSERTFVLLLLW